MLYEPVACMVLQGTKRVMIGDQVLEFGAGQCMVVAAEVPALAQILDATPDQPYLAFSLHLDPAIISSLLVEMGATHQPATENGFGMSAVGPGLMEAWCRYAELLDRPAAEVQIMASHREHELMFRLLMGPQGGIIRQIGALDSSLSRVRRSMEWIRQRHFEHLSIEAMAAVAGMSVSVFHRRFKAVAGVTPLQYQKQFRLHEARRRLVTERAEVATIGFSVGYESASQFSREYKRMFGKPPKRDTMGLQDTGKTMP